MVHGSAEVACRQADDHPDGTANGRGQEPTSIIGRVPRTISVSTSCPRKSVPRGCSTTATNRRGPGSARCSDGRRRRPEDGHAEVDQDHHATDEGRLVALSRSATGSLRSPLSAYVINRGTVPTSLLPRPSFAPPASCRPRRSPGRMPLVPKRVRLLLAGLTILGSTSGYIKSTIRLANTTADGDHYEAAHHQRVVPRVDRLDQVVADPRVVKYVSTNTEAPNK